MKYAIIIAIIIFEGCSISKNINSNGTLVQYQRPEMTYSNPTIAMNNTVYPDPTKKEEIALIENQMIVEAIITVVAVVIVTVFLLGLE